MAKEGGVMMRIASILLVENSLAEQIAIRAALDGRGIVYALTIASSGEEALEIMNKSGRIPEVILASEELPKMSGFEFAVQIRSNQAFSSCRIFILSTSGDNEDQILARKIGVSGIVRKPLRFNHTASKEVINLIIDLMNG